MPKSEFLQKLPVPVLELPRDPSPESTRDLQDTVINKQHEIQIAVKRQSIAFDTEEALSPLSKQRLQKAIMDENSRVVPNDSNVKEAWVDKKAKELHKVLAKGRKADSSTCGYSESANSWSAKEGTNQDLRYTLVGLVSHRCSTVETDELFRQKFSRSTVQSS